MVLGALLVTGLLALEMSGSARRTVGTNWVPEGIFSVTVPHGGQVCQPNVSIPAGAAYARVHFGGFGHRLPALVLTFRAPAGALLASGRLGAGHAQGQVNVPISNPDRTETGTLCLRMHDSAKLALAGMPSTGGAGAARVNGVPAKGVIGINFLGAERHSWWGMLGTLARRFGYGKAGWLGSLTFPLVFLVMLAVWIAALRVLWRLHA